MNLVFSKMKLIKKLLGLLIVGFIALRSDVALKMVVYLQAESFKMLDAGWAVLRYLTLMLVRNMILVFMSSIITYLDTWL